MDSKIMVEPVKRATRFVDDKLWTFTPDTLPVYPGNEWDHFKHNIHGDITGKVSRSITGGYLVLLFRCGEVCASGWGDSFDVALRNAFCNACSMARDILSMCETYFAHCGAFVPPKEESALDDNGQPK